ncbi:hypothetical protein D3C72_1908400 [compost metagenome]
MRREAPNIVAKEVFERVALDSECLHDEAVIGFWPGGLLDRPFEITLLLKIHELADAERAIGQRPVKPEKTASINSWNLGSTDDVVEQAQKRAVVAEIAQL